mgnify:CR=1 FL=1|tara:strand:- start:1605 stop:2102 length:498 start_codon:yes stop_codon:yes gene_type:complete
MSVGARMNDGIFKSGLSLISLGMALYLYNSLSDCGLKHNKKIKMMFVLITLLVFVNMDVWTANLVDLKNPGTPEGFFADGGKEGDDKTTLVRQGLPMFSNNTRHELTLNSNLDAPVDFNKAIAHTEGEDPMTLHARHFYHFIFSLVMSSLLIGMYSIVGAGKSSN